MEVIAERLRAFTKYAASLSGDEKGEAQVFCDRLFQAFGHGGYKEAGATLEFRLKKRGSKTTSFSDLVWSPRLLLEMKKRNEPLRRHYQQAFDYWIAAVPNRPRYVVLCNFDEFWIYDFDKQLDTPVDIVRTENIARHYTALNFLFPNDPKPIFGNDRVEVTRGAADQVAGLFYSLTHRKQPREVAQRFVLQSVVAMFAEDVELLPSGMFVQIVEDCRSGKGNSYDLFGSLFRQMNSPKPPSGGRFTKVKYFNGGLFSKIEPIELSKDELEMLGEASVQDWSKVNPAIFGTIFQQSMDSEERHAAGAHFTSEADIMRVVLPTIVRPWRSRIDGAKTLKELLALRDQLTRFKILDPACGSGNFLYVSYRELVRLELRLIERIRAEFTTREFDTALKALTLISPKQFYGVEQDSFGVELAKVTLMLAKKLAIDEVVETLGRKQIDLDLSGDDALPLENLDSNFINGDALFSRWPEADAIVGNPPYQSKNKAQKELGRTYMSQVRTAFPDVDARADICVYWFRKAHDHLKRGQRAGLVGTNTIRQNYSRMGGLDYIAAHGGTITEAISSQVWSGDAVVHVSIVNWIKGSEAGKKRLFRQVGDDKNSPWESIEVDSIPASLSFDVDVTQAVALEAIAQSKACYQGQTHGHEGFLVPFDQGQALIEKHPKYRKVLYPFLIADDLLGELDSTPTRYVIDFFPLDVLESQRYSELFKVVETKVLPARKAAAKEEETENKALREGNPKAKGNRHHQNFLAKWWQLSYPRQELLGQLDPLKRYIVCARVTKRPIFEFVSTTIRPNDALAVFPLEDDYSFGILQSDTHWLWFTNRCSTLKADFRYTSNTVFDSFPWPQDPTARQISNVAQAAVRLRDVRRSQKTKHKLSLRDMYRTLELPGDNPLKDAHQELDDAVKDAYGFSRRVPVLKSLLELNLQLANKEQHLQRIDGPGLHKSAKGAFVTSDCVHL